MELTKEETRRYARHLLLPEIGPEGQLKLKKAKVLVVGAGGLGCPVLIYLSAAGVGTLGVVDFDKVEYSNLHRQILYSTFDVGKAKVDCAKESLAQINPEIKVVPYLTTLKCHNALEIMKDYDLIVDGSDNFPTRYLVNDACIFLGKPFIYGGIFRFEGQVSVLGLADGPCYRCFFQQPPPPEEVPSCSEAGVVGVLPGMMGLLQANEALKLICQIGEVLKGRLLVFDGLATRFREIHIQKDPRCPICSTHRTIQELAEYAPICPPSQESSATAAGEEIPEITVQELQRILKDKPQETYLLDVREPEEWEIAHIPQAVLRPLSTFQENYQDIPKDRPVYVHCKLGGRGLKAIQFLKTKGYTNCINVQGGIDAWAKEIDYEMPRY